MEGEQSHAQTPRGRAASVVEYMSEKHPSRAEEGKKRHQDTGDAGLGKDAEVDTVRDPVLADAAEVGRVADRTQPDSGGVLHEYVPTLLPLETAVAGRVVL